MGQQVSLDLPLPGPLVLSPRGIVQLVEASLAVTLQHATVLCGVEARDDIQHRLTYKTSFPTAKSDPAPNISGAKKAEKPCPLLLVLLSVHFISDSS